MSWSVQRFCRSIASVAALSIAALSFAQFESDGVVLKSRLRLSDFNANSGNDCWGYVSPSGREYAIMGLSNKISFVEITDPANPVILQNIPHPSSTWGDIKVYKQFAYATSEASGTGIQVIDMSQIDNGIVTLVKTINVPGRSHNLAIDTHSGFLYTCGSNDGPGTTICFDLTNPANPVKVGPNSMTERYQHDGQAVTYTSGPLSGKQLWFGFSEGRGVDIYDMTDKNNPVRINRVEYPDMGYCHQGWLSEDRKYLYVDDEFDEFTNTWNTRSLVFNVEDPYNAYFVGIFTSGRPAVDHNQYVDDWFIFQANYRSGLRIFDIMADPTQPQHIGFFDTYPANDDAEFDGAWSCYPFFPSGTVIVSDINRGLFILDATEALTRVSAPKTMFLPVGSASGGDLQALNEDDNLTLNLGYGTNTNGNRDVAVLELTTLTADTEPQKIEIVVKSSCNRVGYVQDVQIRNYATGQWVSVKSTNLTITEGTVTATPTGNLSQFVDPQSKEVTARLVFRPSVSNLAKPTIKIDQVQFRILR